MSSTKARSIVSVGKPCWEEPMVHLNELDNCLAAEFSKTFAKETEKQLVCNYENVVDCKKMRESLL
jgi:hypothetical protein